MSDTYRIERFYSEPGKMRRIVKRGLTLEEAKKHCSRHDTHGEDWFDGFTRDS